MKLFTKYNRVNLALMAVIFFLSSYAYYSFVRYYLISEVDEELNKVSNNINKYAVKFKTLPAPDHLDEVNISYRPAARLGANTGPFYFEEYDPVKKRYNAFKKRIFFIGTGSGIYQITLTRHLEATSALIRIIAFTAAGALGMIILSALLLNILVLRKLWRPFYNAMDAMQRFAIGKKQLLSLPETDIDEFRFMNNNLRETVAKAENDYELLKEFTENASHEIQTPLSIIKSKLDLLSQDDVLFEKHGETLTSVYHSVKKLSRLSQSLLLLTNIENRQFDDKNSVNLREKLYEKIEQFHEIWILSDIELHTEIENISVDANEALMDIALNNLLSNATRHNHRQGKMIIRLRPQFLSVSNTGQSQPLDNKKIFTRFYKTSANSDANGLGLSILRQICEVSSMEIQYNYSNQLHHFSLSW